jgi:hypothetical protein
VKGRRLAMLTYSRYKFTRFWAVYDGDELLCLTVYRKGALAVIERITGTRADPPKRKKEKKPPPAPLHPPTLRDLTLSHILDAAVNAQGDSEDQLQRLAHIEALAREGLRVSAVSAPQN